jgi:putative membrane protein
MGSLELILRNLHVVANLFWIGSIVAVGVLLAADIGSEKERGALAHAVYRKIAAPAFGVSFLLGAARLAFSLNYFFVATHYMHAKLTLAVGVIAIHHVLGARARRAAKGEAGATRAAGRLTLALVVLSLATAWVALAKPFA